MATLKTSTLKQIEKRLSDLPHKLSAPGFRDGWIKSIRLALGMSARQLAERIGVTQSQIVKLEKSEVNGGITLRSLDRIAEGLDCELVYYMKPKSGSLKRTIESRAQMKAAKLLNLVWVHMALESQGIDSETKNEALTEETNKIVRKMPRDLWDD